MGFFWYILGPRGSSEPHPGLSKCQRGSSKSFIILFVLLGSGLLQASPGWHTAGTSNLLCTPGLSKRSLWLTVMLKVHLYLTCPLSFFFLLCSGAINTVDTMSRRRWAAGWGSQTVVWGPCGGPQWREARSSWCHKKDIFWYLMMANFIRSCPERGFWMIT